MQNTRSIIRRDLGHLVYQAINDCINLAAVEVKMNPDNCYLWIPDFYMPYLREHLRTEFNYGAGQQDLSNFRGFKILPGYENKIVLGLRESPLYADKYVYSVEVKNVIIENL